MIEFVGLVYEFAKDLGKWLSWKEEDKVVDRAWLEKSGFQEHYKSQGYKLRWSTFEKVESHKLSGYEIIYEIDKTKRLRRRIVRRDVILMGKKEGK